MMGFVVFFSLFVGRDVIEMFIELRGFLELGVVYGV